MSEEEENNEEGPEQTEEVELAKFGEKVLRSPKYGAYERLVCQHLVLAVSSDPVNSICHSCRATLSLPKETMEKLKIDRDKVVDILTVALNFKTALELPRGEQNEENEDYDLIWSFAEQGQAGYEKYIQPWFTASFIFHLSHDESVYPEKYKKWLKKATSWDEFQHGCRRLVPATFRGMLTSFVSWAYPQCEELNQKVSSQVSSATYLEVLEMFQRFQKATQA